MRPWNFMITNYLKHLFSPDLVTFYCAINGSSLTARDGIQSFVFALGVWTELVPPLLFITRFLRALPQSRLSLQTLSWLFSEGGLHLLPGNY